MNSVEGLATSFGCCSVIYSGIILFGVRFFSVFHEGVGKPSTKMFGVTKEEAKATIFHVFQQYRLAFVFLNVVPYIALEIMT